jgi:CHASE2 domain-containing sensor protein
MELLEGRTLRELIVAEPHMPIGAALDVLEAVAQAVDHAIERGILHRDVKPGNVLVGAQGVKVLDFGLAHLLKNDPSPADRSTSRSPAGAHVTAAGALPGTAPYMAPELARGQPLTPASDIYSFGVMAHELLLGRLPSDAPEGGAGLSASAAPLSRLERSLAVELGRTIGQALEADPGRRPTKAVQLTAAIRAALLRVRRRHWARRELPRRLGAAVVIGAVLAALATFAGRHHLARELELRVVDAGMGTRPPRAPDSRLVVVSVDEASLAADPKPLADRADEFGRLIERVFRSGARAVAIDFLAPERWARSRAFSQLVLRRRAALTLAAYVSPAGQMIGPECVSGLTAAALGPAETRKLFGLVNVDEDLDGVTRRARAFYRDANGERWDSWAMRVARAGREEQGAGNDWLDAPRFWLDPATDWQRLARVSWKNLPGRLDRDPRAFEGKLVLLGLGFAASGDDYHRVAGPGGRPQGVSGIVLQAIGVDTLLRGPRLRDPPAQASFAAGAFLGALVLAGALCPRRRSWVAVTFAGAVAGWTALAFLALAEGDLILPVTTPLLAGLVALPVGLLLRSLLPEFPEGEK